MTEMSVDTLVQYAVDGKSTSDKTAAFDKFHTGLLQLQEQDGGANSSKFKTDLSALNQELEERQILPGFDITGVTEGKPPNPNAVFPMGMADTIQIAPEQGEGEKAVRSLTTGIFYPDQLGTQSESQKRMIDFAKANVGEQLWKDKHADDDVLTSPDPPGPPHFGGPGGFGCAASVATVLRKANVLKPDADPTSVEQLNDLLVTTGENGYNWQAIYDTRSNPDSIPSFETLDLEPGDVICGYREGESHNGPGAHAGIVGEDGLVYATGVEPDPNSPYGATEVWTTRNLSNWNSKEYTAGIVVLRAPDAL